MQVYISYLKKSCVVEKYFFNKFILWNTTNNGHMKKFFNKDNELFHVSLTILPLYNCVDPDPQGCWNGSNLDPDPQYWKNHYAANSFFVRRLARANSHYEDLWDNFRTVGKKPR